MKKQTFIALFAMTIIVTLFLIPSCRKDHTKAGKEDLLSHAQDYYNRQLQVKISTDTNDIDISLYKPDWNQAVYSKTAAGEDVVGILLKRTDKEQVELDVTAEKNGDITGLIKRYVYATGKLMMYSGSGRLRMQGDYSLGTKTFKPDYKGRFLAQSMGGDLNDIYITGGGGGDTPPIIIITPPPTISNPPGGGGGSTTTTNTSKDISNKTNDPCINKTVKAALNANKDIVSAMADIIKNFDASKSVQINIYDGHIYYKDQFGNDTSKPKPGQTTNQQFIGSSFSADITLGIDYHNGTSKESLIASMIHEIVHAYLGYTSNNFLKTETDHNVIANKYITPMAHYLNSTFGIQMNEAYALAWSGVSDSKVFNENTPNDTEFTVVYGGNIPNGKISVGDINRIAGAYKLSTNDPANTGYTSGKKICD